MSFQYYLEQNIDRLHHQLTNKTYQHGSYAQFTVHDSKRREIAVAPVRDRVVHRLIYDYLTPTWDKTFIDDAWSCRKDKGQHRAIARASGFMKRFQQGWVWQVDITKFFDNVDQATLLTLLKRRITCPDVLWLIEETLGSYYKHEAGCGMPIGNLTSQIFANIYLNELDRYVVHSLQPAAYLRYGDDWLCLSHDRSALEAIQIRATNFLNTELKLQLSTKLNMIKPVYQGVTYLGVDIWPNGHRLTRPTLKRIDRKLSTVNFSRYEALVRQFSVPHTLKRFYWDNLQTPDCQTVRCDFTLLGKREVRLKAQ